jgi:glycosyltransferase involved in cell wall biosynthesis
MLALQETIGLFSLSVVVVDNDANGPARATVLKVRKELGVRIRYSIEAEHSIPAARNHALTIADGNYIGIIDDDEFPPQEWLLRMYQGIQLFEVDGCLGPVHPFFEQTPPAWLTRGRFCERPVYRTGTILHWDQTRTGNVLLKRDVLDGHDLRFDERLTTGGSDKDFFKRAMLKGCRFVAVDDAPVYELVPPERWKKSYYLKRTLVNGFNAQRNYSAEMHGLSMIAIPLKSIAAVVCYALLIPVCACLGMHMVMKCLERGGHHLSRLLGMFGVELIKNRDF